MLSAQPFVTYKDVTGAVPMLELHDPHWDKLGEHVPAIISELAASWDDEAAKSLLYDDLCHQETCYGATYAAIPHLLKIAELDENRHQWWEIAVSVGFVALCARAGYRQGPGALRGRLVPTQRPSHGVGTTKMRQKLLGVRRYGACRREYRGNRVTQAEVLYLALEGSGRGCAGGSDQF
jgi:hypothetical protein